jgi:hypothetical protein
MVIAGYLALLRPMSAFRPLLGVEPTFPAALNGYSGWATQMYLGIETQTGLVYEGANVGLLMPAVPIPSVTQAKLIEVQDDWNNLPSGLATSPMSWMFREDTFDAVTRTRRGRLYEAAAGFPQPHIHRVVPHPYEDPFGRTEGAGGRTSKSLHVYAACVSLLSNARRGMGSTLALGAPQAVSAWRIIQTEVLASGCVMVTLKSLSAFSILPDIDTSKIPEEFQKPAAQALERVLNSAFRETPISVIDHCRNAMTVTLSRWMVAQGHDRSILSQDLGEVAALIAGKPHEKRCVSWLAQVVARLHVRGKANEAETRGLRDPVDEDAELAVHAVGFALRDIGWAA